MVKSIIVSDELHEELIIEAGSLQSIEGKNITLPKVIERALVFWRKKR